ncbi:ribosomal L7Ae/L30e/S12e/Gadd45 family protein [Oscillospiraceae bacterium OttesenSCG-928-F05]|nr:ribosomal L7Ae/L30e/S12e/Gadd45 family protein [Oscillospiraceae bacterium OttesenSCG-928-F05]
MLSELGTKACVVGLKQSKKAVAEGKAAKAFVAEDAEKRVVGPFAATCEAGGVEIEYVQTMEALGRACKVDVKTAVAVLLKDS